MTEFKDLQVHTNYDIAFLSYHEPNADENFQKLSNRFPRAYRIKDVEGMFNAIEAAAKRANTEYFYLMDADNTVLDSFDFSFDTTVTNKHSYIWQAENPVNGLRYGFGGLKLHHRDTLLDIMQNTINTRAEDKESDIEFVRSVDFPVADKFLFLDSVATVTHFNYSPFQSWRSAFREGCKLTCFTHYLDFTEKEQEENKRRIKVWKTVGRDKKFGEWVLLGARDGTSYGEANYRSVSALSIINDYPKLQAYFHEKYGDVSV